MRKKLESLKYLTKSEEVRKLEKKLIRLNMYSGFKLQFIDQI